MKRILGGIIIVAGGFTLLALVMGLSIEALMTYLFGLCSASAVVITVGKGNK